MAYIPTAFTDEQLIVHLNDQTCHGVDNVFQYLSDKLYSLYDGSVPSSFYTSLQEKNVERTYGEYTKKHFMVEPFVYLSSMKGNLIYSMKIVVELRLDNIYCSNKMDLSTYEVSNEELYQGFKNELVYIGSILTQELCTQYGKEMYLDMALGFSTLRYVHLNERSFMIRVFVHFTPV
jgi:hypothetical protein